MHKYLFSTTLALGLAISSAHAEIKVGFITALSGPGASIGVPYARGMAAALAYKNTVGGETIKVIELDDASDPSASARNARKLVEEEKVDIIIGTATAPATIAIAAIGAELKVPVIAVSPISVVPADPTDQWSVSIPQPAALLVKVIVDRMKRDKIKNVGFIGFSDAWGDLVYAGAKAAEARGDITLLSNERYARTDTSVTGQILKVLATKPEAVLLGSSGTQGALPLLALTERNYRGGRYGTGALVNPDFVRVAGKSGEGIQVTTGPVIVSEQLPDGHYAKAPSAAFREAYMKANSARSTDGFSAYSFDGWLVFLGAAERALATAKPGTPEFRKALRDEIFKTRELAGTHAIYNFNLGQSYGVDERSLVVVKLTDGTWTYAP
jgi:branched-chain amino acid transport system substrate-binding protein